MKHSGRIAEVFPPGDFVREELEARGWSQGDLARIIGRPLQAVNQIINGRKAMTAQTAKELGVAFGTGPEVWMNLEMQWRLRSSPEPDRAIAKRAKAAMAAWVRRQREHMKRALGWFMNRSQSMTAPTIPNSPPAAMRSPMGVVIRCFAWLEGVWVQSGAA